MFTIQQSLNPKQLEAATHGEGPLLVIAGAGSGKTRVVTYRIAHLLSLGVPSSEIVAVTFTNKAADEMRRRIFELTQSWILAATFHSLCARILRESIGVLGYHNQFAIFDEDDSEKILKECLQEQEMKDEKGLLKTMRMKISQAKNQLIAPDELPDEDLLFCKIYSDYQKKLKASHALDFDDLLFLTVKLFQQFPSILQIYQKRWSFILIDEYQDTNPVQSKLIQLLAVPHQNVFAVGDPDQSIYSWRGATIQNILHFQQDYPGAKVVTLEQNYRSHAFILNAANALIEHNEGRFEKKLWSERASGEKVGLFVCDHEQEEVAFVLNRLLHHHSQGTDLNNCVIFYRTHFQSRIFEDALLKERIPYIIVGGVSFYMRKEIKDFVAYLRLAAGGQDFLSLSRALQTPKKGIGENTLAKLRVCFQQHQLSGIAGLKAILEKQIDISLSQKQTLTLKNFLMLMEELQTLAKEPSSLSSLMRIILEKIAYLNYLKDDPETYQERRENIEELISKAAEWELEVDQPTLTLFLEELSLKSSQDETKGYQDAVRLMTVHNAKGLEFSVCFLVGMEEELFPHMNSLGNFDALEEERRLCYVGMTRAKDHLYLSASRFRFLWGQSRMMRPSRFLTEIPSSFIHSFSLSQSVEEEEEKTFLPGQKVLHKDFGMGVIQKAYQTSFGLTYDVYFPEMDSQRTLVAKFAKLKTVKTHLN